VDGTELPEASVATSSKHGVDAIIDYCLGADESSVTLCPVGPLTNIGMAIAKEPKILPKIREILWMGGAFAEPGNTTELAEFNAYVDPHAAHVVFTSGVPLTIFPLDVTHSALAASGTEVAAAAVGMLRFYERYDVDKYDIPGAPLHDPCVIAYLVDPTLFRGHAAHVAIDHVSEETIGNTYEISDAEPNATIMTEVDAERFFDLVVQRVGSL
jgi:purine nucleosidase